MKNIEVKYQKEIKNAELTLSDKLFFINEFGNYFKINSFHITYCECDLTPFWSDNVYLEPFYKIKKFKGNKILAAEIVCFYLKEKPKSQPKPPKSK